MVNIFIANLDWSITSEDLKNTFATFGEVHYAHVVYEKDTKRSKGFGYVEMPDTEAAINAIQALNGLEVNGRPIDVKIASPKGRRPDKKIVPKQGFEQKKTFNRDDNRGERRGGQQGGYRRNNDDRRGFRSNDSNKSDK